MDVVYKNMVVFSPLIYCVSTKQWPNCWAGDVKNSKDVSGANILASGDDDYRYFRNCETYTVKILCVWNFKLQRHYRIWWDHLPLGYLRALILFREIICGRNRTGNWIKSACLGHRNQQTQYIRILPKRLDTLYYNTERSSLKITDGFVLNDRENEVDI